MGNPTFCCAGLFITWWGYLAMNSASTLGVEGTRWGRLHRIILWIMWLSRWLQSAKGTVLTMTCSFGGGSTGLILNYIFYGGHIIHVGKMVTTVLGSLVCPNFQWMMPFLYQCQVSYGAITFLCSTIETIAIGTVAALIVFFGNIVKMTLYVLLVLLIHIQ